MNDSKSGVFMKNRTIIIMVLSILLVAVSIFFIFRYQVSQKNQNQSTIVLTAEEQTWLDEHPDIVLSFTDAFEPYLINDGNGDYRGITIDFLNELNARLGTQIEVEVYSWSDMIDRAKSGESDGVLMLGSNTANSAGLLSSDTLFNVYNTFFTRIDADFTINSVEDVRGKSIGILKNTKYQESILKPYENEITITTYPTNLDLLNGLYEGEVEVVLGVSALNYLINKYTLSGIQPEYTDFNSYDEVGMAVRPEYPELISIINKGLATFSGNEINTIINKWIRISEQQNRLDLTAEEQAWLDENPEITFGVTTGFPPVYFLNESGELAGYGVDYAELVTEKLGIKSKIVSDSWGNVQLMLKTGEIDVIPLIFKSSEREEYMDFTNLYRKTAHAIITRQDTASIHSLGDLSHKRVGAMNSTFAYYYIQDNYPDAELFGYATYEEFLQALLNDELDAVVDTLPVLNYWINKLFITSFKVAAIPEELDIDTHMSVRSDTPELTGILNKAIEAISEEQHLQLNSKWVDIQVESEERIVLTPEEQAWLAEHPKIEFGTDKTWSPFIIVESDGTVSGIEAELIKKINEIAGTNISIVLGKWPDMVAKAKAREIDGLLVSISLEERAPDFLFSDSPYNAYKYIFSSLKVNSIEDLKGKRVGFQEGIIIHENFLKKYPEIIRISSNNLDEMILLLNENEVDAILGGNALKYFIYEKLRTEIKYEYSVPDSKAEVVYSIRKDWPELQSIINKALAEIQPSELNRMKEKYLLNDDEENKSVSLTGDERAWLDEHPDITIGFFTGQEPYLMVAPDGTKTGVMVDILDEVNKRLGTQIQLGIQPSISSLLTDTKAQELDGIMAFHAEHSEQHGFLQTQNYISAYPTLFARRETVLDGPADLSGKILAKRDSEYWSQAIVDQYAKDSPVLLVESILDGLSLVNRGDADVFIGLSTNSYLIDKYQLSGIVPKYVFLDRPDQFSIAIRPGLPELVPILNKALASFSENELKGFVDKWVRIPDQPMTLELTAKEQAWLDENHAIQVRIGDAPPYIIPNKDGEPTGIAIDYLKLIAERTGVNIEYFDSGKTFHQALEGLKDHQGPDLMPAIVDTEGRQEFIVFSNEYFKSPYMIFTHSDNNQIIADMDDLIGMNVALAQGTSTQALMQRDYPDISLRLYDNHLQAIEAVASKEADFYIGNMVLSSYLILNRGPYNLKIAAPSPFDDQRFSFGVRNDWPELASIIDQGLATITSEERVEIRNRYIAVRQELVDTTVITKWVLGVIAAAAGIILLFIFWNRSLKKEVLNQTFDLKTLAKKLITAQEDERQHIARELHDESGQMLTALNIQLEMIQASLPTERHALRESITDANVLLKTTMQDLRNLAHGLRPPVLDTLALELVIEDLCRDFCDRVNLQLEYQSDSIPELSEIARVVLYRFVQEALTNIAKHAQAQTVQVELRHQAGRVSLQIADDGVGFDPNQIQARGMGLESMRERLELIAGSLETQSQPGQGTHLTTSIPVERNLEEEK
jgi:ABC-type amino acid transport substrate-binding protein/two-component sensor histidine kinase